jgi:hypothetical protein
MFEMGPLVTGAPVVDALEAPARTWWESLPEGERVRALEAADTASPLAAWRHHVRELMREVMQ